MTALRSPALPVLVHHSRSARNSSIDQLGTFSRRPSRIALFSNLFCDPHLLAHRIL
jgi:hypothetical protein